MPNVKRLSMNFNKMVYVWLSVPDASSDYTSWASKWNVTTVVWLKNMKSQTVCICLF